MVHCTDTAKDYGSCANNYIDLTKKKLKLPRHDFIT